MSVLKWKGGQVQGEQVQGEQFIITKLRMIKVVAVNTMRKVCIC